jgi:hypothetical protein
MEVGRHPGPNTDVYGVYLGVYGVCLGVQQRHSKFKYWMELPRGSHLIPSFQHPNFGTL